MKADTPANRPHFELSTLQRLTLGWKYRRMADVPRLGGRGRGFDLLMDAIALAIAVYGVIQFAGLFGDPDVSAAEMSVGFVVFFAGLGFVGAMVRLGQLGVWLRDGFVTVRNPLGTRSLPVDQIEGVAKTRWANEAIQLTDGTTVALWGIQSWVSMSSELIDAAAEELDWRIREAKL